MKMKNKKMKSITAALCAGIFSLGLVSTAHAALIARAGGMVYDTDLNITWLSNANAGAGSAFDDGFSNTDGMMTWGSANAWAASLTVAGVSGWRLPTADPTCGINFNCTNSEMGHLFYTELGGTTGSSITTNHNSNFDLFTNIQSYFYWSGTESALIPNGAWSFNFGYSSQNAANKNGNLFAWAVHSGDVGAQVPEPGTLALMGLGLMGLLGLGRQQRRC